MTSQLILWGVFGTLVLTMLTLDLGIFHRKAHVIKTREALIWSATWITLALVFNLIIYFLLGSDKALKFLTGYLVEESLSVDNLFVFLVIFRYFSVPAAYQHKVLFWGIIGALMMRAIFIAAGIEVIERFHWVIYLFGAFLIFTGIRISSKKMPELHPEDNPILKLFRRLMPVTNSYEDASFFLKKNGRYWATPLFLVVLVVETTDVIFALDSIPAILAITTDPLIVYSSNVLAISGLRALFFALAGITQHLRYLHYGLSAILVFLGIKMLSSAIYKIPAGLALGVIAGILAISVIASLTQAKKEDTNST